MLTMTRRIALPAVLVAVALALAGCSASGSSASVASGGNVAAPAPVTHGDSAGSASSAESTSTIVKRQVVTTGSAVFRASDPISAANRAASIVDAAGGRVDDRNQTEATRSDPASASLTLRIPSSKLTPTLGRLKAIGKELSLTESTDDVTTKSEDLGARITALRTSITRLLALEARASSTADVITLESDISDRQGQLESLTAQQRYLDDQVAMSTIKLRVIAPSAAVVEPGPPSVGTAFTAGVSGFGAFFTWALLVLTYLLPWLILAAVIWVGIVIAVRVRRRRGSSPQAVEPPTSA